MHRFNHERSVGMYYSLATITVLSILYSQYAIFFLGDGTHLAVSSLITVLSVYAGESIVEGLQRVFIRNKN